MGITACELATPRWGMYSLYLLRFAKLAITSLRPPKFETCSASKRICQFQLPSALFYFCVIPEYNPAGSAATFGLKFVSRRNGTTTFTSLRNFRSSASRCRSVTLSASINADRRRSCPRAAQTQTHTHPRCGLVPGDVHTRAHVAARGARCTVAQVRRPFALPLQSTRRGSVVKSPAECCCSHRQALRTSADAPRARQDDDDAHSPPLLLHRLLRTGRSAPPEFGTRLPLHSVPEPHQ